MADLLGSILGSMEKPPTVGDEERKKAREHKKQEEKMRLLEREKINKFRKSIQRRIEEFIKDSKQHNYKFEVMDKVQRAIVHEVSDVAGLASFSFGDDEVDRYVMLWKKEYAPCDEELLAYRRGEEWNAEKAKQIAEEKLRAASELAESEKKSEIMIPNSDYHQKFEHIIGKTSAKDAAKLTTANQSYGFVPSENKRDLRTIEQVMADTRARKKLKTEEKTSTDSTHAE